MNIHKIIHYNLADTILQNWVGETNSRMYINILMLVDGRIQVVPPSGVRKSDSFAVAKIAVAQFVCGNDTCFILLDKTYTHQCALYSTTREENELANLVSSVVEANAAFFEKTKKYFDEKTYIIASIVGKTPEEAVATLTELGWGPGN